MQTRTRLINTAFFGGWILILMTVFCQFVQAHDGLTVNGQSHFPLRNHPPYRETKVDSLGGEILKKEKESMTTSLAGTLDCSTVKVIGNLTPGNPMEIRLEVISMVTVIGTGNAIIMYKKIEKPLPAPITVSTTVIGLQTLSMSFKYDGSPLVQKTFSIAGLGSCQF